MRSKLVIGILLIVHLYAENIIGPNSIETSNSNQSTIDLHLHAENTTNPNSIEASNSNQSTVEISASSAFLQEELTKIAETCLTDAEYQELSGNLAGYSISRIISFKLCENGVPHIGLTELRKALNFGPLHPWKDYDYKRPNAEALASAPSLEAYYDLKEPWYTAADPRNQIILEKNLLPVVAFFDKRFPSIRKIYRMKFDEILQSQPGDFDRKTIDRMIDEFMSVTRKMKTATEQQQRISPQYRGGMLQAKL